MFSYISIFTTLPISLHSVIIFSCRYFSIGRFWGLRVAFLIAEYNSMNGLFINWWHSLMLISYFNRSSDLTIRALRLKSRRKVRMLQDELISLSMIKHSFVFDSSNPTFLKCWKSSLFHIRAALFKPHGVGCDLDIIHACPFFSNVLQHSTFRFRPIW